MAAVRCPLGQVEDAYMRSFELKRTCLGPNASVIVPTFKSLKSIPVYECKELAALISATEKELRKGRADLNFSESHSDFRAVSALAHFDRRPLQYPPYLAGSQRAAVCRCLFTP